MPASKNPVPLEVSGLVDRYWHQVYKLCLFYLRNVQDAEDATQTVFEKIQKKYVQFNAQADPFTWIYRIAVNTALNMLSRRRIIRWLSLDDAGSPEALATPPALDPAQRLELLDEERERRAVLQTGIRCMSRREKKAFYLFYYERLPQKRIAEILATSVAAVESLVHKAVGKIRDR